MEPYQESKGQEDAILAIKELIQRKRNVELIVIGYSVPWYLSKLRDLVKDESLEGYVRFIDFKENIYPLINQADIVLVCSKNEAFGRVILEAMLLKKVLIGTKSGGILELIEEEFNGLLYEPGDYKQLAIKIEYLLDHREKIREFGEKGYKFAKGNFTREKCVGEIYELLQSIKNMPNPSCTNKSHGWKLLLLYYKMEDKILPVKSHRRNAVRKVFRGIVSLSRHLKKIPIESNRFKVNLSNSQAYKYSD